MATEETHYLALLVGGKEIRGKGYFRMDVGPRSAQVTADTTFDYNDKPIRFQKAVEEWGLVDGAAIYPERGGSMWGPMFLGKFTNPLKPTAGDRLVVPPNALVINIDAGSLEVSGYISEGEAFRIDRIPFHPTISERIHIA